MRYSQRGSEIILVDHLVDDLREGDLLIKLGDFVDEDDIYDGRYYIVIDIEKRDGYVLTSVLGSWAKGIEFEERFDGHSGDALSDFDCRRLCNARGR